MADEQTMRDHVEDLMAEIAKLREQLRDRDERIRQLEVERDYWIRSARYA